MTENGMKHEMCITYRDKVEMDLPIGGFALPTIIMITTPAMSIRTVTSTTIMSTTITPV